MADAVSLEPLSADAEKALSNDSEKPAKDSRSFEERIAALIKPAVIEQPNEEKVQSDLAILKEKIAQCDKRLTEIKTILEKTSAPKDGTKSESSKILEQLKLLRIQIREASQEKEESSQRLRELKFAREAQQKHLTDMRKSLKYDDVQQVDEKIRELERKISYGQCSDLKEEKRVLTEIKQLTQMKSVISQFNVQRQSVIDDSDIREDLERKRAEAGAKLDAFKKEANDLEKALEASRGSKPTSERGPSRSELWKEQKELYGQIKTYRDEQRKMSNDFREELNRFRDYQRLFTNYKRQLQKIQGEQRRAEWEARKKEEEQPVDADVPSDDPLVGHPWAHEILQCSDLEKMLASLLPKEIKADVKEKEADKAWLQGAAGKMSGKEDVDPFAGLAVKKSKGGKKAVAGRLVLTMDTVAGLAAAGVAIPSTTADIPACLATLEEKRKAYTAMTEADKKAAKARATASSAAGGASGSAGGELVAVDIKCSAPDRVVVTLAYPVLA